MTPDQQCESTQNKLVVCRRYWRDTVGSDWRRDLRTCVCVCVVFSYVFVMGDFNFRTDDLSASDVKNSIAAGDLRSLWAYDQV